MSCISSTAKPENHTMERENKKDHIGMLIGFCIILNGFPRLFSETQRFSEHSETLRRFRVMVGNLPEFLGNASTVSDARKPKKVFDKKISKTQRYARIRSGFPKRFLEAKAVSEEIFRFSEIRKDF